MIWALQKRRGSLVLLYERTENGPIETARTLLNGAIFDILKNGSPVSAHRLILRSARFAGSNRHHYRSEENDC